MKSPVYLILPVLLLFSGAGNAIQLGLLDDFEASPITCTTDGWMDGSLSPNPPTGTLLCGELDTCCLQNESAGGSGPGSRQASWNESQWTGDYVAAGVNKIQMQAANASATETIHLRVGVSNGMSCYVSTTAVDLAPNNPGPAGLQFVSFILDPSTMTSVPGNLCPSPGQDSLATVLSSVIHLRLFSSAGPSWGGDAVISTLQIDAIQSKADSDLDGVNDDIDNCTLAANATQLDTNADGFGNACDPDLNNDCVVNFLDLGEMRSVFFMADADADLTGDGLVNFLDLAVLRTAFFGEPGPGLGNCGTCEPPVALGANSDFAGLEMFMRGGLVNDWGATPGINNFSDQTGGLYVARFEMSPGSYEWKIADAGWSLEYCSGTNLVENTPTSAPLFGCAFPANGTIDVPATGCFEFTMQADGNIPPNQIEVTFAPVN